MLRIVRAADFAARIPKSPRLGVEPSSGSQHSTRFCAHSSVTQILLFEQFGPQVFCASEQSATTHVEAMERSKLTVGDFMTAEPCTVGSDLSLFDAKERMSLNNIRHLLVERDGRLVGVVSSRDLSFAETLGKVDLNRTSVSEAMSRKVYMCAPTDDLAEVAREMEAHRYGCAVIVEDIVVVGIFTTTDALRALRQVLTGETSREVNPTHVRAQVGERDVHLSQMHMRVSDVLRLRGASPETAQGTFSSL